MVGVSGGVISGTRCHAVVCVVCWQELYAYVNRTTRDAADRAMLTVNRMTQNDVVRPEHGRKQID